MSIRTEAIDIYRKAYKKLYNMSSDELEEYVLDSRGNKGIGFESNGIKFGFAKASRENELSICPFSNPRLNVVCIPLQPAVLESAEFMRREVIDSFCVYMDFMSEAVLHEIIHLLDAKYNGVRNEYKSVKDGVVYYNSPSELLAYSGEIISCIERKGMHRYFLKMLGRRESVIKFIKREFRNNINVSTFVTFIESLTEENYNWFVKYANDEYRRY